MNKKYSRREFLRRTGLGLAAGAAATAGAGGAKPAAASPKAAGGPFQVYLPLVQTPNPDVVRVHSDQATSWDFGSTWYGDYVNQQVVNSMMAAGLKKLTGQPDPHAAWRIIMPGYAPGRKIAVKINLNNAVKDDNDYYIDALPQVAIALVKTLCEDYGVAQQDIMIYDALRPMPGRFYTPVAAAFPSVGLYDNGAGYAPQQARFNHIDPSLRLTFSQPGLVGERWLTDLLFQAAYMINMPILKKHGWAPVTLGFKNHFGSTDKLGNLGIGDDPHIYINPNEPAYDPATIPLVDINANPNIHGKTVLTIGDGLFGASSVGAKPQPWATFGGMPPNSLLFSRDAVALDCVMVDLLREEFGIEGFPPDSAYDYLVSAEQRGMGVFEKGDPWGAGYNKLKYEVIDL